MTGSSAGTTHADVNTTTSKTKLGGALAWGWLLGACNIVLPGVETDPTITTGTESTTTTTAESGTADAADTGGSPTTVDSTGPADATTGQATDTEGGDSSGSADATSSGASSTSRGSETSSDGGDTPFACDIWAQDCPQDEKCMPWADDGGDVWNATRCTPLDPSPAQNGDVCTVVGGIASGVDDCDISSMCWNVDVDTGLGVCVAFCIGSQQNPICEDPATVCTIDGSGALILCLPQ